MQGVEAQVIELCRQARRAGRELSHVPSEVRSRALRQAAIRLSRESDRIRAANERDLASARRNGLSEALIDRLYLSTERISAMADGVAVVAGLPDPLGETIRSWVAPSGLQITQRRIPIGVIAVIYESRPNVTADVAALCLRSGNAVLLKGGKEAIHSNSVIADLLAAEFSASGIPDHAVQLIRSTDRDATAVLLRQEAYVDLIIPRGGPSLVRAIAEHARVPVIKHYEGVCHVYVHEDADPAMAAEIAVNAKVQRPGTCNALETLVVHSGIAETWLPGLGRRLTAAGVELRADERARALLSDAKPATEDDWRTEYLELVLAVKVVDSLDEAIDFINTYGSGHSDSIVTRDARAAERFLDEVDSAVVYVNASTRFTDGFEFGFGAEVGISTSRIHARGPMGLRELTTYKYVVHGTGQIR